MKLSVTLVISIWVVIAIGNTDGLSQGLTVGDIQVDQAGLAVRAFLPLVDGSACTPQPPLYATVPDLRCQRWPSAPVSDADGSIYFVTDDLGLSLPPKPVSVWRTRTDGVTQRVVHIDPRQSPSGVWSVGAFDGFTIDLTRGALYVQFRTNCVPILVNQECTIPGQTSVVRIDGLPILKPGRTKPSE